MARRVFANRIFNPRFGQNAAMQGVGPVASSRPANRGVAYLTSSVRPSYKSGFARSPGESMYPRIWDNMHSAFVPELGLNRLGTYPDLLPGNPDYTLVNMEADNFGAVGGRLAIDTGTESLSNEYVTSTNAIPSGTSYPWSMAAWVYPEVVHEGYVFSSLVSATSSQQVAVGYAADRFRVIVRNTVYDPKDTATAYPLKNWYHVVLICKADDNRELWVNGQLALTITLDVSEPAFDAIYIGTLRTNPNAAIDFEGKIASVITWTKRDITPDISLLYRDALAPFRRRVAMPFTLYEQYDQICVKQSQYYIPGAAAEQLYLPGATAEEIYTPGAAESQIGC